MEYRTGLTKIVLARGTRYEYIELIEFPFVVHLEHAKAHLFYGSIPLGSMLPAVPSTKIALVMNARHSNNLGLHCRVSVDIVHLTRKPRILKMGAYNVPPSALAYIYHDRVNA